ncbi:peptidase [Panaeolus papilionaceus]|nr:peptidase [Panaeolus papilionaceus]
MKAAQFLALLPTFLYYSAYAALPPTTSDSTTGTTLPVVPNRFIFEVDSLAAALPNAPAKRSLDAVYSAIQARGIPLDIKREFNAEGIFVGAAVVLRSVQDAATIASLPGVKAIRPVMRVERPSPVQSHTVTGTDDPQVPQDTQSTHKMTGVDKLHAQGIFGKGIKIGIIDTGIDYTHPALGGAFGPGHKIIGGHDFVGDDYNGNNEAVPDDDPIDCVGHGTHVAGIIGANPGNPYGISGVAYEASIAGYKVFGCKGGVSDDIIVESLLRGYADGMDILTLSLGGADGWTEGTPAVVASRIAASGKIVTIAAGNDGASGSWYASGPGTGVDVISVASVENTAIPVQSAIVNGVQHEPISYYSSDPLPVDGELPIYATSKDSTVVDDACNPLPDDTPDLSKFVVIVRRGSCSFVQKLEHIAAKGGKVSLIYNNGNGIIAPAVGDYVASGISAADGEFLVQQFVAGAPLTLSFPQTGGITYIDAPTGGLMSSFSSYGPSNDFYFKPSVGAPGGGILSTVPRNSYAVESGTSMATPFVAGCSALLLQVKGNTEEVALGARTLFETTAKPIGSTKDDKDPLQTLTQQGSGLINAFDAIYAKTIVSPGQLVLNDTANFKFTQRFTVKNTENTEKTFKLRHSPAGTALTVQENSIMASLGPVPLVPNAASVLIVPETLILPPGGIREVMAIFTPPKDVDATRYPVYSGFIEVNGPTASDSYHVSYLGLAGKLRDKQVLDSTNTVLDITVPAIIQSSDAPQIGPANYTFVGDDIPRLLWRMAFGTPTFRADLVDANVDFKPTISSRGIWDILPFFTFPDFLSGGSFSQVKTLGPLVQMNYLTRNNEDLSDHGNAYNTFTFRPRFANGTAIPNGMYRVLVRALRVTGEPSNENDYDSWLSPIVGIQVPAA